MRYKPEDAVVLRAMQDMEQLDDHIGLRVLLTVQVVCPGRLCWPTCKLTMVAVAA